MAQTVKLTDEELEGFIARVARGEEITRDEVETVKKTFRESLRDGSFQRRVIEAARPAIEAEDRAWRFDGDTGRYRI